MGNDSATWRSGIGRNCLPDLNTSGVMLLDFCAHHIFSSMKTMFDHKGVHQCTRTPQTGGQSWWCVLDNRVSRGYIPCDKFNLLPVEEAQKFK